MRKERLTIEEIQALPKDAFPIIVTCDDGYSIGACSRITILSPLLIGLNSLAMVNKNGMITSIRIDALSHYPSLKPEPNTKRFYERVGTSFWVSDDGDAHNGVRSNKTTDVTTRLKTGRYFDWDMDSNKIVGKVEVE